MSKDHIDPVWSDANLRIGALASQPRAKDALLGARTAAVPRRKPALEIATVEKRGFDPYNSGSFDLNRAWSRVGRR
jgi:hypothetical protein